MLNFNLLNKYSMFVFGGITASAFLLASPAQAQTAFKTGPYVGVGIGYSKMNDKFAWRVDSRHYHADHSTETEPVKKSSFTGSLYAGYNWRFDRIVVGLEADISASSLKHKSTSYERDSESEFSYSYKHKMSWFATLRPRAGYLVNESFLLYGTAGIATARISTSMSGHLIDYVDPSENMSFKAMSGSRQVYGWTAGAGFEYALNKNWSVRGEYLHTKFSRKKFNTTSTTSDGDVVHHNASVRPKINQVRVGLTYIF